MSDLTREQAAEWATRVADCIEYQWKMALANQEYAKQLSTFPGFRKGDLRALRSIAALLTTLTAENARLRLLAERNYPALKATGLCSIHQEPDGHYECEICYPNWQACCGEHVAENERLSEALKELREQMENEQYYREP